MVESMKVVVMMMMMMMMKVGGRGGGRGANRVTARLDFGLHRNFHIRGQGQLQPSRFLDFTKIFTFAVKASCNLVGGAWDFTEIFIFAVKARCNPVDFWTSPKF